MHEELWVGVDLKVANAGFFLEQMGRSLEPLDGRSAARAMATSVNVDMPLQWQRSFYAHLDAFLVTARSIPEVINCCFGADRSRQMRSWFVALPSAERARRRAFSKQFQNDYDRFRGLDLSNERNVSFHRKGRRITGRYSVYIGNPANRFPMAETQPIVVRDTPALQWAATEPPPPIRPNPSDFSIGGKPLFAECRSYLVEAERLSSKARIIVQLVHGTVALTVPS